MTTNMKSKNYVLVHSVAEIESNFKSFSSKNPTEHIFFMSLFSNSMRTNLVTVKSCAENIENTI